MSILSPIGDLKSPIGDNISNWGLGIYESGNAESENKSPIPNWIKYHRMGIRNFRLGILYPIGYFLLLVLYSIQSACHRAQSSALSCSFAKCITVSCSGVKYSCVLAVPSLLAVHGFVKAATIYMQQAASTGFIIPWCTLVYFAVPWCTSWSSSASHRQHLPAKLGSLTGSSLAYVSPNYTCRS